MGGKGTAARRAAHDIHGRWSLAPVTCGDDHVTNAHDHRTGHGHGWCHGRSGQGVRLPRVGRDQPAHPGNSGKRLARRPLPLPACNEAVARRAIGAARPAEAARRREAQSPRWVPSFAGPGGRESFVLGAQWMDSDRRSGDAATPGGRDGPNGRTFMAPKSRGVWGWRGGAKYRPASRGEGWA